MDNEQNPPHAPARSDDDAVADIERQQTGQQIADRPGRLRHGELRTIEDSFEHYDADQPKKRHRVLRFAGWMLLIVVLTGSIAAAGWYFWLRNEAEQTPSVARQTDESNNGAAVDKPVEESEPVKLFSSDAFGLQFEHPEKWKVSTGADNRILAVSPPSKLKLANGKTQIGQILFTIQRSQPSLPAFAAGDAVAVRESEKIDYKKPSQVQRASTYVSFLGFANSTGKGIDSIYVTGDFGYIKDQLVSQTDIVKADPLIAVSFQSCKDNSCSAGGDAVTLASGFWDDKTFSTPIKTMLQSIVVQ